MLSLTSHTLFGNFQCILPSYKSKSTKAQVSMEERKSMENYAALSGQVTLSCVDGETCKTLPECLVQRKGHAHEILYKDKFF